MNFYIITLFPEMFNGPLSESILKRAQKDKKINIELIQLRDFATNKHKTVDDTPCGGGAGMVLKANVIDRALRHVVSRIHNNTNKESRDPVAKGILRYASSSSAEKQNDNNKTKVILLTPSGEVFNQKKAISLSKYDNIILIAGHYEGFDQRIHDLLVDEEVSIGQYVLTGGELPAMVLVDAISRMVPGVIKKESMLNESFMPNIGNRESGNRNQGNGNSKSYKLTANSYKLLKDFPVYTRPIDFKGHRVPDVLLSGDHEKIKKWRNSHKN